ncbi:MAG: hypothetical protein WDO73_22745 [Ignavibacteriota bacterium]
MTVEQFIQSTVEGPGALSPEGLAFHEKRVAEAEAALKEAKRLVAVADAKAAALAKRQAAINSRLAELNAAIRDKAGLRAVVADLKAVKAEAARRASLEAEQRLLSEALQLLVAGDLTDAELSAKEARLDIKRAQRAWVDAKGRSETALLWAALAPAMRRDPNLTIQLDRGGVVVEYVKKLGELDAELDALGSALARETHLVRQQQMGAGSHNTH